MAVVQSLADRTAMAHRHVSNGLSILNRQRELIKRRRDRNLDVASAEELLTRFQQTQEIFERDLARLLREHE